MKKHRFFTEENISKKTNTIVDKDLAHQIRNVLKIVPDETLIFINGDGFEYESILKEIIKDEIKFEVQNIKNPETEIRGTLTLYASIVKRDNFEFICQKAVELGATHIVPIISARTIKTGIQTKRIEMIIKEAVEQSGRVKTPKLGEIQTFAEILKNISDPKSACLFDVSGEQFEESYWQKINDRALFIGPEGGFTEKEISDARARGIIISHLGSRILRAETAAIVGCYEMAK